MKYIIFTFDFSAACVAKKLKEEGNEVILAVVQDAKELGNGLKEDADAKKKRLSLYDGVIQKFDAKDVLRNMIKVKNKDEWFVIFDMNTLWKYSQLVMKMGYKNGFFPTEEQFHYEDNRDSAKDFVKKHYPDLPVAEVHEFKTIDEGIQMLQDTENIYVLKANIEGDLTVLPSSDDPELAKEEIIAALTTEKGEYEKAGYILEQKINNPIEITPQAVFYNGELVFTDIDIENKPIGAGSQGPMTGCSGNLIIKTNINDKINKIAFPKIVYEMAKKQPGMFVWDSSILIDENTEKMYFGEFCPNRWGFDAIFTELSMSGSCTEYFENVMAGRNPLKYTFGAAVRMFNLKKHESAIIIKEEDDKDIYVYDERLNKDHIESTGDNWNLLVAAGVGNTVEKAVDKAYEAMEKVAFTGGYIRPKFDFLSREYQNSIPNRFDFTNKWLYNVKSLITTNK